MLCIVSRCAPTVSLAAIWWISAFVTPRPRPVYAVSQSVSEANEGGFRVFCGIGVGEPVARQTGHWHSGSMGVKSSAYIAERRLRTPVDVMALPKRWCC
jgi:hypothetical protein